MNMKPTVEDVANIGGISLVVGGPREGDYSTCRIQKGLLLVYKERNLSEEGMGFGVPVLKSRKEVIFPGSADISLKREDEAALVRIDYDLNLVERMAFGRKKVNNRIFYAVKEYLSFLHREYPFLRGALMHASNILRLAFGINTQFEEVASRGVVRVLYIIDGNNVHASVDTEGVNKDKCGEIILLNEQGARCFNKYHDSNGLVLTENAIGTWEETLADAASFIDSFHSVEFTLFRVPGSRMFRGRELVGHRLAWAGLAYSIPPSMEYFTYDILIKS